MAKIADKVFSIINPIVIDMGYELLGIEYVASGKLSVLRIYIDCEEGIGVDDRNFTGSIGSVVETSNTIELVTELGSVSLDIDLIEKANLVAHF